jgi:hypothetical protein
MTIVYIILILIALITTIVVINTRSTYKNGLHKLYVGSPIADIPEGKKLTVAYDRIKSTKPKSPTLIAFRKTLLKAIKEFGIAMGEKGVEYSKVHYNAYNEIYKIYANYMKEISNNSPMNIGAVKELVAFVESYELLNK